MPKNTANIFVVLLPPNLMDKSESCSAGGACGVGLIGLLCPVCIPAIAAFLASIGLGFFATKEVVWTLLALFGVLFLLGLFLGFKRHKNPYPLLIGALAFLSIPIGRYVIGVLALTYIGVVVAIGATIWNMTLDKKARSIPYFLSPPSHDHL